METEELFHRGHEVWTERRVKDWVLESGKVYYKSRQRHKKQGRGQRRVFKDSGGEPGQSILQGGKGEGNLNKSSNGLH